MLAITKILLLVDDGVIETLIPTMSVKVVLGVLKAVSLVADTTCRTLPAGSWSLVKFTVPPIAETHCAESPSS